MRSKAGLPKVLAVMVTVGVAAVTWLAPSPAPDSVSTVSPALDPGAATESDGDAAPAWRAPHAVLADSVVVHTDVPATATPIEPAWLVDLPASTQSIQTPAITTPSPRAVEPGTGIQAATVDETARRGRRSTPPTTAAPSPTPTTVRPPNTAPVEAGFDLALDRFYINQAVPVLDTARPANERIQPVGRRGGLARAFVVANDGNSISPEVELHWRHPGGAQGSITLAGPASTPTNPSEAALGSTFNREFGSDILLPGTEVYVVVDPRNLIEEADETNNRWPTQGWADARVANVPELRITWVPVVWAGGEANVTAANVAQFEDQTMRMMPIPGIDSQIHAPFTFNGDLRSGSGWSQLLDQIAQLRAAEGSDRLYHAIVRRPSGFGIAGIGFIGTGAAVSHDDLPEASGVVAHELGHNFGLPHAPCGNVGFYDGRYPYSNARIGAWGYDLVADVAINPGGDARDLMSYCEPNWISDYNFRNVLNALQARTFETASFDGSALHVSGSIEGGRATIDPAFALDQGGVRPVEGGYTLVGAAADGDRLFEVPFAGHEAEINGGPHRHTQHFSFSVPASSDVLNRLVSLTVEVDGVPIGRRQAASAFRNDTPETAEQVANADGTATVTWDDAAELAIVRNPVTGEILALGDAGSVDIADAGATVEVILSDGMGGTTSEMVAP